MSSGAGFVKLFNGKDLSGWKGLVANPVKRAEMSEATLAKEQKKADERMHEGWHAEDGNMIFSGIGDNICTVEEYGDFEMFVDWLIRSEERRVGKEVVSTGSSRGVPYNYKN